MFGTISFLRISLSDNLLCTIEWINEVPKEDCWRHSAASPVASLVFSWKDRVIESTKGTGRQSSSPGWDGRDNGGRLNQLETSDTRVSLAGWKAKAEIFEWDNECVIK